MFFKGNSFSLNLVVLHTQATFQPVPPPGPLTFPVTSSLRSVDRRVMQRGLRSRLRLTNICPAKASPGQRDRPPPLDLPPRPPVSPVLRVTRIPLGTLFLPSIPDLRLHNDKARESASKQQSNGGPGGNVGTPGNANTSRASGINGAGQRVAATPTAGSAQSNSLAGFPSQVNFLPLTQLSLKVYSKSRY